MKMSLKALIPVALLVAGFSSTTVLADNPAWTADKAAQVAINRCANSGGGNGAERINNKGNCVSKPNKSEDWKKDIDPGNS